MVAKFFDYGGYIFNLAEIESVAFPAKLCDGGHHYEIRTVFTMRSGAMIDLEAVVVHEDNAAAFVSNTKDLMNLEAEVL